MFLPRGTQSLPFLFFVSIQCIPRLFSLQTSDLKDCEFYNGGWMLCLMCLLFFYFTYSLLEGCTDVLKETNKKNKKMAVMIYPKEKAVRFSDFCPYMYSCRLLFENNKNSRQRVRGIEKEKRTFKSITWVELECWESESVFHPLRLCLVLIIEN